jgi:hypothetical protein
MIHIYIPLLQASFRPTAYTFLEVPRIGHSLETIKSTISSRCSLAHSTNQFPELCEGLDESSATNKVCLVTRRTNLRKGKEDAFWSFPYIARPQFLRASVHDLLRALSVRDLRGRNIVSLPYALVPFPLRTTPC